MAPVRKDTLQLVIRNELADLSIASESLERFCVRHGVAREPLVQLQVALDEIASNVIKYAWPEGGRHEFTIHFTADSDGVKIEILDDGQPFDPRSAPAPKRTGGRRRPGGAGIPMTRQLMDDIEYIRTRGTNHIKLTKRCATHIAVEEK
jgi:serine/threonine-protein kinase RsbW